MKADVLPFRFRTNHQLPNGVEHNIELVIVFLAELFQLAH